MSHTIKITLDEVRKKPQVILKTMEDKRSAPESHCRGGHCGVCKCTLKAGKVRYLREPLAFLDDDEFLPCVSIPDTETVEIELEAG